MPEYLAPGVYIEETSFRAKTIEGVSTTTTGFVGPTRYGPVDLEPDLVTSLVEFERVYGDMQKLEFEGSQIDNFMWHAVRAFSWKVRRRLRDLHAQSRPERPSRGERQEGLAVGS